MHTNEIINKIASVQNDVYNYIINTEHWLFYWISNEEVQDFIKEYPNDYEEKVHLSVSSLNISPSFKIKFDEHPNDIENITMYAYLPSFKEAVYKNWMEWNGKIKEIQIKEKEENLSYYKRRVEEIEEEIKKLKNYNIICKEEIKLAEKV